MRVSQTLVALGLIAWTVGCTQPNSRLPDGSTHDTGVDGLHEDRPLNSPDAIGADGLGGGGQGGASPDAEILSKLTLGKTCGGNTECESGHCVEGVCCSSACTDLCSSCLMMNTGKSDGTCAPAQAGADPHNDCDKATDDCGLDGTCDGAGACRKALPNIVCKPESCASGQYTGPSQCDGKGACVTPAALSCGNFPCAGGRCNMTCSGSIGCLTGFYCTGTSCMPQKGLGSACGAGTECVSGNCVEGVCCNGSCTGKCKSCLNTNTGNGDGQCSPVKSGVTHGSDCQADGTTCGLDGTCDGSGSCRKATTQKICAAESCSAGKYTGVSQCDGNGTCAAPAATSCGAYACGGTKCKTTCSGAGDCATGNTCLSGICSGLKPNGGACLSGAGTECMSGICVGGICCGSACTATSQGSCGFDGTCDATGNCRRWPSGTQCGAAMCTADNKFVATRTCDGAGNCSNPAPDVCGQSACDPTTGCKKTCGSSTDCASGAYCDSTGHCAQKKAIGVACGAGTECSVGNCVEGVCCDSACTGTCTSCLRVNTNQADGQCRPVTSGQSHKNDCTATAKSSCGTDGTCDGAGACRRWPAGTVCKDASCINANSQSVGASSCDGAGHCNAPGATACQAYLCNPATMSCRTSCGSSSDCSSSAYCTTGSTCMTKKDPGAFCDGSDQCKSGACNNRCCDSSNLSCSCPQPNTRNHLKNPGFDTDLSNWNPNAGGGSLNRISPGFDDSCPVSGAARFSFVPGNGSPPTIFQCVTPLSPSGNYNFGVSLRGPGHCILEFFSQTGCAGTSTQAADHEWINEAWGMPTAQVFGDSDTHSARVTCYANPGATFFDVDMIYLSDYPIQF